MSAVETDKPSLTGIARERLQTKVRQTLGRPLEQSRSGWNWRWILGFAAATAVILLLTLPRLTQPTKLVVQVAMLDVASAVHGSQANAMPLLRNAWKGAASENITNTAALDAWEKRLEGTNEPYVKVVYDRPAAEVRVVGRWKGMDIREVFLVEPDLAGTLKRVEIYLAEEFK